ncbi:MAG: hypothetical protein ACOYOB_02650 [Myxococcota bacterium]
MTDARREWFEVLDQDARAVATLLRSPAAPKAARQSARACLGRAAQLLEPETATLVGAGNEPTGGEAAPEHIEVSDTDVLALVLALADHRRGLGDHRAGLRPLQEVWRRSPLPERLQLPLCANRVLALVVAIDGRFNATMALSAERLGWFEKRCSEPDPTRVAKVRPPDAEASSRLDGSELELLVKAGRSRFS